MQLKLYYIMLCAKLMIPVINEIFHTNYTGNDIKSVADITELTEETVAKPAEKI